MTVVQVCARCASQWPVAGAPAQWCPRCQGVLLSPVDTRRPAPVAGRNFRWVARSPYPPEVRRRTGTSPGPTPRYRQIPRWGLLDPPPDEREAPARRTDAVADLAPTLLACTALVFGLATLAEAFRYGCSSSTVSGSWIRSPSRSPTRWWVDAAVRAAGRGRRGRCGRLPAARRTRPRLRRPRAHRSPPAA